MIKIVANWSDLISIIVQVMETEDFCVDKGYYESDDTREGKPKLNRCFLDISTPAVNFNAGDWWRTQAGKLEHLTRQYDDDKAPGGRGLIGVMTAGDGTTIFKDGRVLTEHGKFPTPSHALEFIERNPEKGLGLVRPVYMTSYRMGMRAFHFGSYYRPVTYAFDFIRSAYGFETMHQAGMRVGTAKEIFQRAGFSLADYPKVLMYDSDTFQGILHVTQKLLSSDGIVEFNANHPISEAMFLSRRGLVDRRDKGMRERLDNRLDLNPEGGHEIEPVSSGLGYYMNEASALMLHCIRSLEL